MSANFWCQDRAKAEKWGENTRAFPAQHTAPACVQLEAALNTDQEVEAIGIYCPSDPSFQCHRGRSIWSQQALWTLYQCSPEGRGCGRGGFCGVGKETGTLAFSPALPLSSLVAHRKAVVCSGLNEFSVAREPE